MDRRTSTRKFDEPAGVTDAQRAAVLHAASRAPSAGAMMMYSIIDIREQATLDRPRRALRRPAHDRPCAVGARVLWSTTASGSTCSSTWDAFEDAFCERHGCAPKRHPGLGDLAIASQDAVIAAQNAVIAAEAVGLGSC
ncbi:MAG: nitroreductase family protein [Collinsella sp.]